MEDSSQVTKNLWRTTDYLGAMATEGRLIMENLSGFEICLEQYSLLLKQFAQLVVTDEQQVAGFYQPYLDRVWELVEVNRAYEQNRTLLLQEITQWLTDYDILPTVTEGQKEACIAFAPLADQLKGLGKQIEQIIRLAVGATAIAEKDLDASKHKVWDERMMNSRKQELEELGCQTTERLELTRYYYKQVL